MYLLFFQALQVIWKELNMFIYYLNLKGKRDTINQNVITKLSQEN